MLASRPDLRCSGDYRNTSVVERTQVGGGCPHSYRTTRLAAEVTDLVAFLCSAHAGFITGAVVDINGGFLIR